MTEVDITHILVMEDNPGLAHLLQKRLQRQGFSVELAPNGEEGLDMARATNYDLLIVDYNMPFLGGIDVIRALSGTEYPPIIMITGEGNEEIAVEAIKLGAADYIVKDVELKFLELLPTVIHQVLFRQQLIKERGQMQEQARESEARYRRLFESSPQPMWVFDINTLSFLAVNDAAIDHYGYSREDFLSMSLEDIRPEEDVPRLRKFVSEVPGGISHSGSWRHRRKDGAIINVEIVSQSILFGQRQARFVIITDITARKKLEEELAKAQKLESLGILAGGLAHDFNNLLTAIIGNISLAKLDTRSGEVYERLDEAERASERARNLTQQLLTFSRGGVPVKKTLSFKELIRDVANFVLRGSKSKCSFAIPHDLWNVEADEGQLSQVIDNLVINADQAMPEGGTVSISCRNVTVDAADALPLAPGKYAMISVRDTGIGIPREHLGKVFDPYFTTKQKGTGLGLATTYSIIKRHSGHVAVESTVNKGTAFHIYLPATSLALRTETTTTAPALPGSGRVLIMDDEEMVREVAGKVLSRLGYDVAFAQDGTEAVTRYQQARADGLPFDLVIMDLTIPGGMGGKDAVKRLLEINPSAKAVVSSGYSDDPVMANYAEYGFSGMVSKPYTIKTLGDTVRKLITGTDD